MDIWLHWIFYAGMAGWIIFSITAITVLRRYRAPAEGLAPGVGVSVVIAARNEVEHLKAYLPKILNQNYRNAEVVVVNDRSDDGSDEFLSRLGKKHENLRIVHIEGTPPGLNAKKYALIRGARAAAHEILLFTDADCAPISDAWIAKMVAPFSNREVEIVLGYSQYCTRKGWLNRFIRFETLTTGLTYVTLALAGVPYMGVGRNIAYRKPSFLDGPGYGPHSYVTGGDDDLMVQRMAGRKNTAVCLHEDAMVYSVPEERMKDYWRQKIRHLSTGLRYRMLHKTILALLTGSKVLFWSSGIAAILSGSGTIGMAVAFFLTHFCSLAAILLFKRKTADKTDIRTVPLLELFFIIYYISAGLAVLGTKEIKWK